MYRVNIPTNPKFLLDLAAKILKKHTELAAESPLNALESNTWTVNGPKVAEGLLKHQQAEEWSKLAEEATKQRNLHAADLKESVKATRDLLLGIYRENPKKLGEFGFDISYSTRTSKKKEV